MISDSCFIPCGFVRIFYNTVKRCLCDGYDSIYLTGKANLRTCGQFLRTIRKKIFNISCEKPHYNKFYIIRNLVGIER